MKKTTAAWVGPWLAALRMKKKLTIKDIATRLDVHPSNVARRECGQAFAADELPGVLAAYGVTSRQFSIELDRNAP